jgi:ABC-type glycerol-3-phosphate transport system permease component
MSKKNVLPSEIAAQLEAENAAALEALRRRREKEHRKMMKSKGSNKRVGKSWANDIGIMLLLTILGLFMVFPIYLAIINSVKPIQEIFYNAAETLYLKPNRENFEELFKVANNSWVPFSRNVFNSIFITAAATVFHVLFCLYCCICACKMQISRRKDA